MVAIMKARQKIEPGAGSSARMGRFAMIQPRRPSQISTPAPSSFAAVNAVSEVAIRAVMPAAERVRNSVACNRIAATHQSPRRKPWPMPVRMQLRWFGPGVVTKITQNSAKTVQASQLMAASIDRRGDRPDRHGRFIIGVDPGKGLLADAEAVARMDGECVLANLQVQLARHEIAHLLGGAGDGLADAAVGFEGAVDHLEIVGQVGR